MKAKVIYLPDNFSLPTDFDITKFVLVPIENETVELTTFVPMVDKPTDKPTDKVKPVKVMIKKPIKSIKKPELVKVGKVGKVENKYVPVKGKRKKPKPESYSCNGCKEFYPRSEFLDNHGKKRWVLCKECRKYRDNTPKEEVTSIRLELLKKLGGYCIRCGYREFPTSLHFHHKNPKEKTYNLATLISKYSNTPTKATLQLINEEIEKCVLLCANCHNSLHTGKWDLK